MRVLKRLVFGLGCVLVTTPALAQDHDGWSVHLALGGYLTAAYADTAQTAFCLGQQTCREVNPLARHAMDRWGVVPALTLKGAINTGVAAVLLHDHARHPKRAFWLAVLAASVQSVVVVHNARAMRRARRD